MIRKPVILIMTSGDEIGGASVNVAAAVRALGTHNVVVLSDDKYGRASKGSHLESLVILGEEYRQISKAKGRERFRLPRIERSSKGKLKGRNRRIANAVRRYRPELVLTVTPYSHYAAAEAKKRAGFDTHILYMVPGFTVGKRLADDSATNVYIVENADMKAEMVRRGIPSKRIMTMGLPYDAVKPTPLEAAAKKQELGLPRSMTVYVNVGEKDAAEILSLLADQGKVLNVAMVATDPKVLPALRVIAESAAGSSTIALITKEELADEYLSACDAVVTGYDQSIIYRCFKMGKPVITFGRGENALREIGYLADQGLVIRAKENLDIVGLVYRLMQTDTSTLYSQAGEKWTEICSLENIANYLTSYIGM